MKKLILMSIVMLFATVSSKAQSTDEKAIKEVITMFAKAVDKQDADKSATYLDDNFRIVMNRLFGSTSVSIMPKNVYIEKVRTKEFGGDDRKVEIESITLNGITSSAKVSFIGNQMKFVSILTLVKDTKGKWTIVGEMPVM